MRTQLILGLAATVLVACSSLGTNDHTVLISDLEISLNEIRGAVLSMVPVGQRAVSGNGREILSKYFTLGKDSYKPAADALERYYAHITILGDRRPYNVEIEVVHEKRVLRGENFVYVVDRYDRPLARELQTKLEDELAKRREDRNIIDDFRVF